MEKLNNCRLAGNIHKKVEEDIKNFIKPGVKLIDICKLIENNIFKYSSQYGKQINNGIAFPTGIAINNIAAHWTPELNDKKILKESDVCKIDFGSHINGWIVDSAFSINLNNKYNSLLEASKEAVDNVIKNMGTDMLISELSIIAEEIVKSYELVEDGEIKDILPIENLTGHSIDQWNIHSGKMIPSVRNYSNQRIEGDEFFAVEVFTTTGNGVVYNEFPSNHFMLKKKYNRKKNFIFNDTEKCLKIIENNFKTLAFCTRFLEKLDKTINYNLCLNELVNENIINSYPPFFDIPESKIAHFEHTVYINENQKEILS